ncbi:MAG: L,D-transpeptidase [Methylococcales bacterium]|nr:L,D-transpeptidase [Methylococcales bacterium]
MLRAYLLLCLSLFAVPVIAATEIRSNEVWLLIDTKAKKIEVKKGEKTVETLEHVAIGRGGAGLKSHRGDNITPHGEYHIGWIGDKSMFKRFFGLTYPSVQDAEQAFDKGIINEGQYKRIVRAQELGQIPPQDTPLGGQIGIHGLGSADIRVHEVFDWTHGCIALTNSQIDHLSQLVDTGTVVKIK